MSDPADAPLFEATVTATVTAHATHPDGVDVPPPYPNPAIEESQS